MSGCNVRDDMTMCPMGLFLDEHVLVDGEWIHPDEVEGDE